jgi:hypothetical protein
MARLLSVYLLLALVGPLPAWSRPTTGAEARRTAAGWLARDKRPLGARMGILTGQVRAFQDTAGNVSYFVVSQKPAGFVVVSGDDLLEPIIAFAGQGTFDPSPDNPLYSLLQHDLPGRLVQARAKEAEARGRGAQFIPRGLHRRARHKWQALQQNYAPDPGLSYSLPGISDLRVPPLLRSTWSQGTVESAYCYNYYTPNHYVCGCVATALAQVMRFFALPKVAVGTPSFTILVDGVTQPARLRGGDGSGGPYDWANMVLSPDASITEVQCQAIGALTYDVGVAVHMQYTLSSSGAYSQYVASALTGPFGYSNARFGTNYNYSLPSANLTSMINPNLDAGFPAILGISSSGSGHEIGVDGYGYNSSTLYHHLNLGWAGAADAWYNLPTIDTGYYNFTAVPECTYNIFPQGLGEIISGRVLDAGGNPVTGAQVTAVRTGGGSYTATSNDQGIYALAKIPSASTYDITPTKPGSTFYPRTVTTGTSVNSTTAIGNLWGIDFVEGSPFLSLNQALDNNSLACTTGGDASWFGQTPVSNYGGNAAQSGALGENQSCWLQTTVVGPGTLSFSWKVSSEADYDFLELLVDNVTQSGANSPISGNVDWQRKTVALPVGSHSVTWVYSKDESVSLGSDCGWVDQVAFTRQGVITPVLPFLLD